MPTNHHTNSWERLLKDQTEEFKMIPSEKSWKSIHKKARPSRKFPSFTAITVFLTIFFSARPLGSKHIAGNEGMDKVKHISAAQKKTNLVHKA